MKKFLFKTFCVEIKNFSKIQSQAYNGHWSTDAPDFEVKSIDGFTMVDAINVDNMIQFFVKVGDNFYISNKTNISEKKEIPFSMHFVTVYLPLTYDENHLVIDDNELIEVSKDDFYSKIILLRS